MGIFLCSLKQKIRFISWTILIILGIEIYAVIIEAQNMINSTGFISSGSLKGVTANRNITAFSLAIKLPFVLYLFYEINKSLYKILICVLIFLTFLSLSMIQSRASFLGVGIILIGFILLNFTSFLKDKKTIHLFRIGYLLVPFILSIIVNQTICRQKVQMPYQRRRYHSTNDGSVNQLVLRMY